MNTRDMQGSFIALISTPTVKEVAAESVPIHPRANFVAELLLQSVVSRTTQRRLAEDASFDHRVYRFSSVDNETPPCWISSSSKLYTR